jgi:hypothetical protein
MAAEIKANKDVDEIRTLINDIEVVSGEVNKIESIWNAYKQSIPAKNVGDDEIGVLFKKLLSKDYRYVGNGQTFDENIISKEDNNSLKDGLFYDPKTPIKYKRTIDSAQQVDDSKRALFKNTLTELCEKLKLIKNPANDKEYLYDALLTKIIDITEPISPEKRAQKLTLQNLLPVKFTPDQQDKTAEKNAETAVTNFINEAKQIYDSNVKDDQYTITERKNVAEFFKKSENKLDVFIKPVKTSQEVINKKVTDVVSKLIEISTKYSNSDSRIKKDILEKLKPKDIAVKSEIDIIERVTTIVDKMVEDHKVHSNITSVTGGASKKKRVVQFGGAPVERETIFRNFEDIKKDINTLKALSSSLYKKLYNNSSTSDSGNINSTGEDSIFNRLYEKYVEAKDDTTNKGPFVASTELINDLKSNDLYPDDVLKIDMRDKFVFIAVTLFIRIISLMIIDFLIDKKIITRMDSSIFWYGVTMTGILILFVLLVNFDSYKLRIIFNYVNFHIGYMTTVSYIFQLWLFGGMIYYIMLKINDDVISSATNDEERARLKHKVQVVSMITWFFLTIGVLLT